MQHDLSSSVAEEEFSLQTLSPFHLVFLRTDKGTDDKYNIHTYLTKYVIDFIYRCNTLSYERQW
jgi:hypothetical protein